MRRAGLRSEILVTLVTLLGSALLLGGFLLLRFSEQTLLQQKIIQLRSSIRAVATTLAAADPQLKGVPPELVYQLLGDLSARSLWVYDRELQPVFAMANAEIQPFGKGELRQLQLDRAEIVDASGIGSLAISKSAPQSLIRIAVPVLLAGKVVGVVAAGFSLDAIASDLQSVQKWLFFYALTFGLVLMSAGMYLLNRNVVQPTKKLLLATQNVTTGDLSLLLDENGPREIAELAESFNDMILALRHSQQETEKHIISLEHANAALLQVQNELIRSEKLATVGHLAAGMAHEIGNPLGALTGYLALLHQDMTSQPAAEILAMAASEAERIDRLVRELLDYAAPGRSFPERIDPWSVVMESVRILNLQGALKGCELVFDPNRQLPEILIDRHKLTQVFINLLLNSKDACANAGTLTLEGADLGETVMLQVKDNGCGVPQEHLDSIFEPFFTTKAPGKGRGLGLAVCQRLVAEAGGDIHCQSPPGQGSVFTLNFPKVDSQNG